MQGFASHLLVFVLDRILIGRIVFLVFAMIHGLICSYQKCCCLSLCGFCILNVVAVTPAGVGGYTYLLEPLWWAGMISS